MRRAATQDAQETVLAFRVGDERFGVAASLVREVGRMPRTTWVPHAPASMIGLGNIRGTVLPIVSFARLTGRPAGNERRVILLDTASPMALAVDDIATLSSDPGLRRIDAEALAAADFSGVARPRARVAAIRSEQARIAEETVPLVAFLVADQEFALPIGAVQEVLPLPDQIAELPYGDDAAIGSIAVRDVLLPLLSLHALLGLPLNAGAERRRVVITRIGSHRVGLVVDAMRSVVRVPESQIDAVPPVLARGSSEARIQAICRLEDGRRLISVLAPEHLVREDLTARLLESGATEDGMATSETRDIQDQFLIFRIGDTEFGLPIDAVIEVAALPARLGRLPKAPAFVLGVMTLRGVVIPVIDQSLRFLGTPAEGARRRVVVVRLGDLSAGFVVDAVADVRGIAAAALSPAPDLGSEETRLFDRVATLDGDARMILIVSPQELLDRAERDLLGTISEKTPASTS